MSVRMPKFGLFTADADLHIRTWDAFLAEVTGIPAASALGRPVHMVLPEAERRGLIPMLQRVLQQGTVEVLAPALHPAVIPFAATGVVDPERVHQRVVVGPLREDGRITGVAVTVEDVTSRLVRGKDFTAAFASDDWKTRHAAVRELSAHGPEIVDGVVRTLREQHRNFNVLSSILDLLLSSDIDVVQPLVACLKDDDADLRIQAAWILGERRDIRAIPALIGALDDADANVQFHAIEALGALRATAAVDRLVAIAERRDFFLSFPAIQALRRVGDASVAPRLVALLDDPLLRAGVSEALGELGDELAVPELVQLLNQPHGPTEVVADALSGLWERYENRYGAGEHIASVTRRTVAAAGIQNVLDALGRVGADRLAGLARVLGWLRGAAVERALTRLLGQSSVRAQVVEALVRYGTSVVELLIEQLSAEDLGTRQAAVLALGRIGDCRATPALVAALADPELALPIAGALARLGDRDAFEPLLGLVGHPAVAVRQGAIGALNSIGHPEMAERITPLLSDPSPLVRESAVKIAGYFGYPECVDRVLACCSDPVEAVRRAAIDHLPFFEDPRLPGALAAALERDTGPVRAAAAAALARVDREAAIPLLRRALADADPWVRYFALRSVGTFGDNVFAPAVHHAIAHDAAEQVRVAAIDVLGRLNTPDAAAVLGPLSTSEQPDVARAAIRALALTTHPSAGQMLQALGRGEECWRRVEALMALGTIGGPAAIDALQWAAAADLDPESTAAAVRALAALAAREGDDTTEAIRALVALTSESGVRETAIAALAGLSRRAGDIAGGLGHRSPEVRRAVIEALSRMKHPEATRHMERALGDGIPAVRAAAVAELRRLGSREAVQKLLALARTDPDDDVRRAAMLAVTQQRPELVTSTVERWSR